MSNTNYHAELRKLLSGGERMTGIPIDIDSDRLQGIAMRKQLEWWDNPNDPLRKSAYGQALLEWAHETKNKHAIEFAESLLQ